MSDFFSRLNPWAKGAIIFLGIVVLFVIFNYEPSTNGPELEKTQVFEYSQPLSGPSEGTQPPSAVIREENLTPQEAIEEKASQAGPAKSLPMAANKKEQKVGKEFYSIQVASFRKTEYAKPLAATLKTKGYEVEVVKQEIPGKGMWYRVYVGRYASKKAAREVLDTLQKKYDGAFLKKRQGK